MAKFRVEINVDNDNTWMRTEFSLGMVLENVGKDIHGGKTGFKEMYRDHIPIKDAYGNVVGHYEMIP